MNDLVLEPSFTKREEIDNFQIHRLQQRLEEFQGIISGLFSNNKKWYVDPDLLWSFVDFEIGVLSSRLANNTNGTSERCLPPNARR